MLRGEGARATKTIRNKSTLTRTSLKIVASSIFMRRSHHCFNPAQRRKVEGRITTHSSGLGVQGFWPSRTLFGGWPPFSAKLLGDMCFTNFKNLITDYV